MAMTSCILCRGPLVSARLDQISTNYIPNSLLVGALQQFWGLLYNVRVILCAHHFVNY